MSAKPGVEYHGAVFKAWDQSPRWDRKNIELIERWEAEHSLSLPGSVREFYCLKEVDRLLEAGLETHRARPLELFLGPIANPEAEPDGSPAEFDFLDSIANSGRRSWFSQDSFLGTDDPPLFLDHESCSMPFSGYVANYAWLGLLRDHPRISVEADVGPPHLDFLSERCELVLSFPQDWEGRRSFLYYLECPDGWVILMAGGNAEMEICEGGYLLMGRTTQQLLDLYHHLWPCHGTEVEVSPGKTSLGDLAAEFQQRFPDVTIT